jgi:hypothetical protein
MTADGARRHGQLGYGMGYAIEATDLTVGGGNPDALFDLLTR